MKAQRFILSSEESEILLAFEKMGNIDAAAKLLHKDASGVSRQLTAIAKKCSALEKRAGRWVLTESGKSFNSLARNVIQTQQKLLENRPTLVIGTTREFGARVIGPHFLSLQKALPKTQLSISTFEAGTEEALLKGRVDIGIDCGRPFDPGIAYKLLLREPIVAVCNKSFRRRFEAELSAKQLYQTPHLLCERLYPDKIFAERENQLHVAALFNDIATTRSACLAGIGWALLPKYSVESELEQGSLVVIEEKNHGESQYGLWWPRARQVPQDVLTALGDWLKEQKL